MDLKKYQASFSEWDEIRSKYQQCHFPLDIKNFGKTQEECFRAQELILWKIFFAYIEFANIKDSFQKIDIDWLPYGGMSLHVQSEKMGNVIKLGIYERTIFLETDIIQPAYLNKMTDEFWLRVLMLRSYGHFEFEEYSFPDKEELQKELKKLKSTKSEMFNIISYYIFLGGDDCKIDFGRISVKWPLNIAWNDLLINGLEAFKILYKTNYDLYRHCYLLKRGRLNK